MVSGRLTIRFGGACFGLPKNDDIVVLGDGIEQFFGKRQRHADAAMGCRSPPDVAAVNRHSVVGQSQGERHLCVVQA